MVKYVCQARGLINVSKNSKKYATEWKGNEAKHAIKVKIQSLSKRPVHAKFNKRVLKVFFMVILFPKKKLSNDKIFHSRDKYSHRHQRQMLAIKSVMW